MCHRKKQTPPPAKQDSPYGNGARPEIDTTHYEQTATNPIPNEMPKTNSSHTLY